MQPSKPELGDLWQYLKSRMGCWCGFSSARILNEGKSQMCTAWDDSSPYANKELLPGMHKSADFGILSSLTRLLPTSWLWKEELFTPLMRIWEPTFPGIEETGEGDNGVWEAIVSETSTFGRNEATMLSSEPQAASDMHTPRFSIPGINNGLQRRVGVSAVH